MIKKFIHKLLGRPSDPVADGRRTEVPPSVHGIDPALVDDRATKVVRTLQEAGYEAYIVGGAVRDLLLGHRPKDFDVATNATPEQVKGLFRRAFIIGRRFRIVHVVHGRGREHEVIEVSTFRAYLDATAAEQVEGNEKTSRAELAGKSHVVDASGRVLRDNVWGPQHEDAARRDFTVNALYYDPARGQVFDYHHGVRDLQRKTLRMIGDPRARYREDPVRMLRAVRLSAKLDLRLDPLVQTPIREIAELIENVPAARLFDEMLKLLFSGHAVECLKRLRADGLHHGLLPLLDVILEQPLGEKFVMLSLADTDRRVREGKRTSPGFLFATLLWHEVLANWEARKKRGELPVPAMHAAMDEVLDTQGEKLAITRRIAGDIKDIWLLQPRFEKRGGRAPFRLIEQARFRAAWDFLRLRADSGEAPQELADWWAAFEQAGNAEREALLKPETAGAKKRRRRRGKKPAETGESAVSPTLTLEE